MYKRQELHGGLDGDGVDLAEERADQLMQLELKRACLQDCLLYTSTAYSLSAGGPVVEPTARNFIVSPICAHSVHANAYVLSPERVITVQTEKNSYKPVLLSVDGGRAFSLRSGDSIEVRRSKFDTKLVRLSKRSFCEILQKKMLMGGTSNEE